MKATEKESTVKRMREIRDSLNKKIEDMDFNEEKAYIKHELEELKRKRQVERKK